MRNLITTDELIYIVGLIVFVLLFMAFCHFVGEAFKPEVELIEVETCKPCKNSN